MRAYSVDLVTKLLRSYVDFRFYLLGQGQKIMDDAPVGEPQRKGELPLGMTVGDRRPWPFREPRHARAPRNGKLKAQKIQEIWVSMIDIENDLRRLDDDDLALIYKYYLFQTHTLDELAAERGGMSRPAMLMRARRAVERLVLEMEKPK